ncbi:hypothetical protein [Anaerorhabdus sp.]|uniref:hypothetical protein n=1 Tax=Anaerorhabdus sp. TaxID=1872524 RepID=UPI002FCC4F95
MKKSILFTGVVYTLVGCVFLFCGIVLNTKINSILWGLAGAGIGPGVFLICKYLYWSQPKNTAKYVDKMENEEIEQHDERKEMLRNKTGRVMAFVNLAMTSLALIVFSILNEMEVIIYAKPMVIACAIYFNVQICLQIVIFKALEKKY